jgi:hypothetical protein
LELLNGIRQISFEVSRSETTAKKHEVELAGHSSHPSLIRTELSTYVLTAPKPLISDIPALPSSSAYMNMVILRLGPGMKRQWMRGQRNSLATAMRGEPFSGQS